MNFKMDFSQTRESSLQSEKKDLCIIGINGTAKRITQFVERYNLFNIIGYAVDKNYIIDNEFHGKPVWAIEELDNYIDRNKCQLYVALFWNHLNGDRRRLYERLKQEGWQFSSIISPLASIRGSVGENCWIMDYVVVQEGAAIGNNVIVSDFCLVGNGTIIDDHCFLAARSTVMGSAYVGKQTFIGVGSTVFDVVHIGNKCLVGACTIQKYDMPDCSTSKVLTDNVIIKKYTDEEIESKWVAKHPNRINKNRGNI